MGIGEYCVPRADLPETLRTVVGQLRSKSAATLRVTKDALRAGRPGPVQEPQSQGASSCTSDTSKRRPWCSSTVFWPKARTSGCMTR